MLDLCRDALFVMDAHRDDGRPFIVQVDELLSAFVELEKADSAGLSSRPAVELQPDKRIKKECQAKRPCQKNRNPRPFLALSLNGKVAIVTGASSGIGRATAMALALQGVQQVVTGRSSDKLETLRRELPAESMVVPADMTNPKHITELVQRTVERFGRLDILLANAGIYLAGDVLRGDPDAWDRLIQTNVSGVFRLVHAALPHLIESGSGDIVVTSSISGHQAIHWEPVYSASKHAIQSFVHGLRRQLLQSGVRVGAVAPGIVLNELWGIDDPAEIDRRAAAGEGLRSGDVAEAIVFMLTRPGNVTIRDLVMLPRSQDL